MQVYHVQDYNVIVVPVQQTDVVNFNLAILQHWPELID